MKTVYTHVNVDLDNASSIALMMLHNKEISLENIKLVPSSWEPGPDGLKPGDLAIDIFAGGHGIKGKDLLINNENKLGSAFTLILENMIDKGVYYKAFQPLADFLDSLEAVGNWSSFYKDAGYKIPSDFPTILQAFSALKFKFKKDDFKILEHWAIIIEGLLEKELSRERAIKDADRAHWFAPHIAYIKNAKEPFTSGVLYHRGAKFLIFERTSINTLGVRTRPGSKVDLGKHLKELLPEWFHHPSGFMSCWGSDKAPQESPPQIEAETLADYVLAIK